MNASSSAYIVYTVESKKKKKKYTYHFTGVISIEHNLSLSLQNTSSQGEDILNGARNQPDQVTLSVVETDAEHEPGWSKKMLKAMKTIKKDKIVFRLVTSMMTYKKMILTDITATQDEENQDGWSGTLVCTQYVSSGSEGEQDGKTTAQALDQKYSGVMGSGQKLTDEQIREKLKRAGIKT